MKLDPLTKTGSPFQHLLIATATDAHDALLALNHNGTVVRFARGKKAGNVADFFDEFSAALQFPFYFGENWDAFSDCFDDLSWLNARAGVIVVFTDSLHLLKAATAKDVTTLKNVLKETCEHRNGKGKPPFHIVFQTEEKEAIELQKRWTGLMVI